MGVILDKTYKASKDTVGIALEEIDSILSENVDNFKVVTQLNVVSDEIIANIVNYSYPNIDGDFIVEIIKNDNDITINYKDHGIKFNPLDQDDPDITLSAEERDIGGLGIFMIKKMMDEVKYEYVDNSNVLTVVKKL